MSVSDQQVSAAAAQILALINSCPRTPTQEAIAAIIVETIGMGAIAAPSATTVSELDARVRELAAQARAAEREFYAIDEMADPAGCAAAEDKVDALKDRMRALAAEVYAAPVANVQACASLATFWGDGWDDGDDCAPEGIDDDADVYTHALARLLEAVLQTGGRRAPGVSGARVNQLNPTTIADPAGVNPPSGLSY
jgi:hypothetical protein